MRRLIFGVACATLLTAAPALAIDPAGLYVGIIAGAASPGTTPFNGTISIGKIDDGSTYETPTSITDDGVDPAILAVLNQQLADVPFAEDGVGLIAIASGSFGFGPGLLGGATLGYGFGNGVRVEAELSSASFHATTANIDGGIAGGATGGIDDNSGVWSWENAGTVPFGSVAGIMLDDLGTLSFDTRLSFLLVDGWYDIETPGNFKPYIGGGVGFAQVSTTLGMGCSCSPPVTSSEIVPAASIGGGVRVKLNDRVTLDAGYRYKLAFNSTLTTSDTQGDFPVSSIAITQSGVIGVHAIQAGLTFALQ